MSQTQTSPATPQSPAPATSSSVAPQQQQVVNPAVPQTPYASASLYVGDLSPDVSEALLFEMFNGIGAVASVRVCRDASTRRSLGYAYVNFVRLEDAERALDTMNFALIRNRPCRIMWSHRDPTLRKSGNGNIFVKNLHRSIDNKQLYDTFSVFGNILSCKVSTNDKGESLGYGFVHYETDEAAANAIAHVHNHLISGQQIQVAPFKSRKERGSDQKKFTNVFVKNLPDGFTSSKLEQLFAKYGKITSFALAMDKEEKSRGFGFVNFERAEDAVAACDALNNVEIDGKKLYVSRAQLKEEREKELRDRFEQLKQERQKKFAGVNLYVKNLSDDVTDDRLRSEFAKYGSITSARVMKDGDKSRGFGFVCFTSAEEATKAVTEMNSKMLDGKPLYVALAQRKEVRRAQLEAQHAQRYKMGGNQQAMYPPQGTAMFYPQGIPQQRMVYPPQMMTNQMPRGGWSQQAAVAAAQGRLTGPPMMGYAMNPQMGMVGNGRGAQGNGSGTGQMMVGPAPVQTGTGAQGMMQGVPSGAGRARGGQQQGGKGGKGPQPSGGQGRGGRQNYKFTPQVRNQQPMPNHMMQSNMNQPMQMQPIPSNVSLPGPAQKPLTIEALAAAPEEQQKQMIGERLYPLIQRHRPLLAGKITGMLLEMDNGELLHLLESSEALMEKINEALTVLDQHESQESTSESVDA